MYLKPMPKKIVVGENRIFFIDYNCEINLGYSCNFEDLESAKVLKKEIEKLLSLELRINKSYEDSFSEKSIRLRKVIGIEEEAYKINIGKNSINIVASSSSGMFYGIQTLIQIIKNEGHELSKMEIDDSPYFKNRGYYHDITRGKVPTLDTLKELVDRLSAYKINQLQLYIEHSFAFKELSEVWFDKDPLTAEEILLLDEYCKRRHVELIPSISTFGHLYEVLRSKSFSSLCELGEDDSEFSFYDRMAHHTLDVSNEDSLKLVEKMIHEFLPLFSSKKVNIGCDETFDLGKGKSKDLLDSKGSGELYIEFLNKIVKIAKEHHKEVLFWGDVILKYSDLLYKIDKEVTCLNWNYYHGVTEDDTKIISKSGINQYVCPGVAGWNHFVSLINDGYENISKMISYGVKYGADGILITDWGDYGHINLFANSIALMVHGAALSWNPSVIEERENVFKAISLLEYGDYSEEIINLLSELSKCQELTWYEIVLWKEKFLNGAKSKDIEDFMKNIDYKKVADDYYKAREIEKRLIIISSTVNSEKKLDFEEFIISAQAIALINDFSLWLLRETFNISNSEPINNQVKLAESIENWFYNYRITWRKRNKESELIRVTEVVRYMISFLRTI